MTEELRGALIAGASAIVGGLITGAFEFLRDYLSRPELIVDYLGEAGNQETTEYTEKDGHNVSEIYTRARVRNTGRRVAKGTRVFLASLSEVHQTSLIPTKLYDSKQLAWAGGKWSSLDIPPGVNFYADVLRISKHKSDWIFCVEHLFATQQSLRSYKGTYQFHLVATADNAEPAHCWIDVTYDGDWNQLRAKSPS